MSMAIAHKRELTAAVHVLVNVRSPQIEHLVAAAQALAQVYADTLTIDCKLVLRIPGGSIHDPRWEDFHAWGSGPKAPAAKGGAG